MAGVCGLGGVEGAACAIVTTPEIAKMFDIDGDGIGDILGCDAAWKCAAVTDEQIAGYELTDLYEQKYGAESMIQAAIEGAMKKNEPAVFIARVSSFFSLECVSNPPIFHQSRRSR